MESPQPPQKKSKKILLLLIPLFLLIAGGAGWFFWKNKPGILSPKKQLIEMKKPKLIEAEKVTKKISSKEGGEVILKRKNVRISLFVPPGALKNDADVSLTPLAESPLGENNAPGPDTDNPPQPPNEPPDQPPNEPPDQPPEEPPDQPPDQPPDEPDDQPPDETPPWIWVDPDIFQRPVFISYTRPLNLEEVKPDLSGLTGLMGAGQDQTPKPRESDSTPPGGGGQVLIGTGTGSPEVISTHYFFGGFGGPIITGGPVGPELLDPPTARKILDMAVVNGGGNCTPEFINAYIAAMNAAQAAGQTLEANAYKAALEECKEQEVDFLKKLCDTDRRLLRRQDFEDRIIMMGQLPDAQAQVDQIQELKKKCIAQYRISKSGTAPGSGGSVSITSSLEAQVCGYVDEEWQGDFFYELMVQVAGGSGNHTYEGPVKFNLPYKGGTFAAQAKGSHSLVINGMSLPVPLPDLGFEGHFDSASNVDLNLYGGVNVKTEIIKESDGCDGWIGASWTAPQIPLVPLPK